MLGTRGIGTAGRYRPLQILCVALALTLVPLSPASAQVSTFDLSGTVKDDQGGVLPGVTVTVRNEQTGTTRAVVTDQVGLYYFAALPPQGTWALSIELTGFTTQRREGLRFAANTKPKSVVSPVRWPLSRLTPRRTRTSVCWSAATVAR